MSVRAAPIAFAFVALILSPARAASASPTRHDLLHRFWTAVWIGDPSTSATDYGVYHFRKAFDLAAKPASFVVHVSADNRFRLFVNGVPVGRGPARGDPMHWRYETIDLAAQLRPGRNVIAAEVWNAADSRPWAQMSVRTAFLLQGDTAAEDLANTNTSWRVQRDPAYQPEPIDRATVKTFIVSGDGERIDASVHPWGWEQPVFDDHAWAHGHKADDAIPYGVGTGVNWWLVPDRLPPMEETPQRLQRVRRSSGVAATDAFLRGGHPLVVPADTHATLLLDQTFETNAYPSLTVSGGKDARITLTYAEALVDAKGQKGNRNDIRDRHCIGKSDVFLPDGGDHRRFMTLWFRTYRYVELEVQTADTALTLEDLSASFTGYPFTRVARFESDDPSLRSIWDTGWRTARLCAHETYFDCPYYEQLQYVGDTRIQSLISLTVAGDDRLVRNAIELFDLSRIPEGLTQGRYPSATPQIINTFSLFWVQMVHDYWMYRDDRPFVQAKLGGIRNVLDWFTQRVDPKTGLVGALQYWTFVDWTDAWPWNEANHIGGEPPGVHEGGSAIVSLQLAMTLNDAAALFDGFGDTASAARFRRLARGLNLAVFQHCWNAQRKLFADTPDQIRFSQHANVLAVLSGAADGIDRRDLIQRVAADPSLVQCSAYFRFYLLRAMTQAGLGDAYIGALGPWREMIARGLTTFAEKADPTRSDCHAWSASPCYEFLTTVAGIEPAAPGFASVRIAPHPGPLKHVTAAMPTGAGEIAVDFTIRGGRMEAEVSLPDGKSGDFTWHEHRVALHPGSQHVTLE